MKKKKDSWSLSSFLRRPGGRMLGVPLVLARLGINYFDPDKRKKRIERRMKRRKKRKIFS